MPDPLSRPATAMLLAAGRGERMRPLSDHTPKPMLFVHGKPLMQWAMESMQRAGVEDLVVNTAWLAEQIPQYFGYCFDSAKKPNASERQPMQMHYSNEGADFGEALETAGGIIRALPLLAETFWVAAGDVWMPDFSFSSDAYARFQASHQLAHIWLVPNPAHNPRGDFGIAFDSPNYLQVSGENQMPPKQSEGLALNLPSDSLVARWTFSTVALYKKAFFQSAWCDIPAGNPLGVKAPLAPMLRAAMDNGLVGATLYAQTWSDVGTPERLVEIQVQPVALNYEQLPFNPFKNL
jgi:MurNAc alpha-1-phosphate uridylyltransferase